MRKGISNQRAIGLHDTRHYNFTTNARSCPSPFAHEIDTSKKRYLDTVVDQKPQKPLCKRTTQPDHHRNARQNAVLTIFSISRKCSYRNHAKKKKKANSSEDERRASTTERQEAKRNLHGSYHEDLCSRREANEKGTAGRRATKRRSDEQCRANADDKEVYEEMKLQIMHLVTHAFLCQKKRGGRKAEAKCSVNGACTIPQQL